MNKELEKALAAAAVEPCTAYSCSRRRDCAEQKLACEAFVYYVTTGRTVHPLMTFKTTERGQKPLNVLSSTQAPTRKFYERVFKPDSVES